MRDQLDIKQKFDYGIFNKIQCGNEYSWEYLIFCMFSVFKIIKGYYM